MKVATESDRELVISKIRQINLEKPWQIDAKPWKKNRTKEQNDKWHAMIRDIAKEMGYTPNYMKCLVKHALGYTIDHGDFVEYVETSKMKVDELTTLIEQTCHWAAEHDVYLE